MKAAERDQILILLKKDYKERYKDFLQGLISHDAFNFEKNIDLLMERLSPIKIDVMALAKFELCDNSRQAEQFYRTYYYNENTEEIISKIIKEKLLSFVGEKKYFELLNDVLIFVDICFRYYLFYYYSLNAYNLGLERGVKGISFSLTVINFLKTTRILKNETYQKLDFTGSGQILLSILINNADFLNFSGVQIDTKQTLVGYDKLLALFKENYSQGHYEYLNYLFNMSSLPLKELIFSRGVFKRDLMVKGYGGKLGGSAEKIREVILNFLHNNFFTVKDSEFKEIQTISFKLARDIDDLIKKHTPLSKFNKLLHCIVQDRKVITKDQGLSIPTNLFTYRIDQKESAQALLKMVKITEIAKKTRTKDTGASDDKASQQGPIIKKKLKRSSRRKIGIFLGKTAFNKLETSLGANLIHTYDALVVYYIKRQLSFLNSSLQTATIFDCFVFESAYIPIPMFRDIARVGLMLAFDDLTIQKILEENKIKSNVFYEAFQENIFTNIPKEDPLIKILLSNFLFYLFSNKDRLFNKRKPNLSLMRRSLEFMTSEERILFERFMLVHKGTSRLPLVEKQKINSQAEKNPVSDEDYLETLLIGKYVLMEFERATHILRDNYVTIKDDSLIKRLRQILNNDLFLK